MICQFIGMIGNIKQLIYQESGNTLLLRTSLTVLLRRYLISSIFLLPVYYLYSSTLLEALFNNLLMHIAFYSLYSLFNCIFYPQLHAV